MLTDKQIRFCNEYLVDYNATQAAIRSGYSKKTACEQSSRLLANVKIQEYLNAKKEKIISKMDISLERTLAEAGRIAFQDARKYFDEDGRLIPIHELDDDAAAALAGMDIEEIYAATDGTKLLIGNVKKIKRYEKTKAIELLLRYHGAFEKDNSQKKLEIHQPLSDTHVDKIIAALREK